MRLHHVHFYVDDANTWRDRFLQTLVGTTLITQNPHTTHTLQWGSITLRLSSPPDPIATQFLSTHSPGIGTIGLSSRDWRAIAPQLRRHGGQLLEQPTGTTIISPLGIRHALLSPEQDELQSVTSPELDHLVLNVPAGQLEPTVCWYENVFGFQRQQTFQIETGQSGLRSQVLTHPVSGLTLPINEPTSPQSQIQEFLDYHGGAGIQHLAVRVPNLIQTVRTLRQAGMPFLTVPALYYAQAHGQTVLSRAEWQQVRSQQLLIDRPPTGGLLLQIFSQPMFTQPTFFWEFIERRQQAQGFGEGNFLALFRAIEQAQIKRGNLAMNPKPA